MGALILKDNRIIATGYNGQPSGWSHEPVIKEGHDVSTIHAEQNCIALCAKNGVSLKGCEILVTHFPCHVCTKLLLQAGIQKIWYLEDYRNEDNPFKDILASEDHLTEAQKSYIPSETFIEKLL